MLNPLTQIPASVRKWLYLAYGVVGLVLGALQVADVQSLGDLSTDKALQVLAYVGLALGFTAAANVTATNTAVIEAPENVQITTSADADYQGEHRDDSDMPPLSPDLG